MDKQNNKAKREHRDKAKQKTKTREINAGIKRTRKILAVSWLYGVAVCLLLITLYPVLTGLEVGFILFISIWVVAGETLLRYAPKPQRFKDFFLIVGILIIFFFTVALIGFLLSPPV